MASKRSLSTPEWIERLRHDPRFLTRMSVRELVCDVVEAAHHTAENAQLVCDEEVELDRRLMALREAIR